MEDDLQRYETYASGIKKLLLFSGLWPSRGYSKIYRIIPILYIFSSVFASSGMMSFVFDNITNVGVVTKGLGLAISCYTSILKVVVFSIYRNNHAELKEMLEIGFRKDLANAKLRPILLSPLEYFYQPTKWLTYSTWLLVTIYIITPLLSIIIQVSNGFEMIKYRTPFHTKYPWSYDKNVFIYLIQYISEIITSLVIGATTTSVDALFGFYVFQMTSQFRTLSYRMNNLITTSGDSHSVIKECVNRHQMLCISRDKLQTLYGPIILWMLMTSATTMCANIFQASQMSIEKSILVFVYIIMKLLQTLLYGWYGLFLTTESEAFQESIYSSGWPDASDRSLTSKILIMLMFKPLVLKACHFSVISLDMFIAITNTAVSYFFLLQTLDEKRK